MNENEKQEEKKYRNQKGATMCEIRQARAVGLHMGATWLIRLKVLSGNVGCRLLVTTNVLRRLYTNAVMDIGQLAILTVWWLAYSNELLQQLSLTAPHDGVTDRVRAWRRDASEIKNWNERRPAVSTLKRQVAVWQSVNELTTPGHSQPLAKLHCTFTYTTQSDNAISTLRPTPSQWWVGLLDGLMYGWVQLVAHKILASTNGD